VFFSSGCGDWVPAIILFLFFWAKNRLETSHKSESKAETYPRWR
jgi:hypothetical protein